MILNVRKTLIYLPDNCYITLKNLKELDLFKSIKDSLILNLVKQSAKLENIKNIELLRRGDGLLIINKPNKPISIINNSQQKEFLKIHSSYLRSKDFELLHSTERDLIKKNSLKLKKSSKKVQNNKRTIYLDVENVPLKKILHLLKKTDVLNIAHVSRKGFNKFIEKEVQKLKLNTKIKAIVHTTIDRTKNSADRLILEKLKEDNCQNNTLLFTKDKRLSLSFQEIVEEKQLQS